MTAIAPPKRGAFLILFAALFAIGAGNTMLVSAVIPPLTRTLALPDWMGGAIFSISAICWVATARIWGKKSNDWGRRRVAAIGLAGYAVSMLLIFCVASLAMSGVITSVIMIFLGLALARMLFGLIGSGVNPAAQAYIADRTTPDQRQTEMARVSAAFGVGAISGPAVAGIIASYFGLLTPVLCASIFAAFIAVLIWFKLPENRPPSAEPNFITGKESAERLWSDGRVFPFLLFSVALSLVTGVLMQTFIYAMMDKLGLSGVESVPYTSAAFSIGAMGTLLAQLGLIPWLKASNRTLILSGACMLFVGTALIIPTTNLYVLIASQFFIGLGQGLARPGLGAGSSLAVGPALQGDVAGLLVSSNAVGFIISPFLGPFLYEYLHPSAPFVIVLLVVAVVSVFTMRLLK